MAYDNTNSGAIFPNQKKTKPNHPDFRGKIDANGTEFWVSAWKKTAKSGQKYLSIALTEVEDQGQPATPANTEAPNLDDFDDEIPF